MQSQLQLKAVASKCSHVASLTCRSRQNISRTSRCTYVRVSAALNETPAANKDNKLSPVSKPGRFDAAARKSDELFYFGKSKAASAGKSQGFKLQVGDIVSGVVLSVKPYGAFIDVGGATGLLHVSEISSEYVVDVSEILSEGDQLKVMILNEDREQGRLTLTTKRLEKTPGDMIRNPQLVFDGAEGMAKAFRARMEAIAMGADTMSMDELLGSRDGYEPMPFLPPAQTQVIASKDNTLYKF